MQEATYNGEQHNVGYFKDDEQAVRAHDRAAKEHYSYTTTLSFEGCEGGGRPAKREAASWWAVGRARQSRCHWGTQLSNSTRCSRRCPHAPWQCRRYLYIPKRSQQRLKMEGWQ
jgi:hypothetical protein